VLIEFDQDAVIHRPLPDLTVEIDPIGHLSVTLIDCITGGLAIGVGMLVKKPE